MTTSTTNTVDLQHQPAHPEQPAPSDNLEPAPAASSSTAAQTHSHL